ncbi:TonB-dependent hemoglobin/transferrin/lactoferrin family receptor [Pacificimonas sp. WHA3]|uniref:TonB-dependent hemoglobin/transferrin/lactoferrin family receptor n=1 Tax=Pacificimonas pallii TaxID=2827236 RepID=A0ABS6SAT5_9SPHN|nr:TonB-dependent hemoglobin/transferrin/lactoferrin family receptor [Pacificimonas pallii]MBV7255519.1 TonB-dependent hemoglobin/transferrin/lactoferrin family receptor [Pacificimonas pallii]
MRLILATLLAGAALCSPVAVAAGSDVAAAAGADMAAGTAGSDMDASSMAALDDVITVTATRLPKAVEDVPRTVSVIDSERIADELATDIKELIRFEPGVSVRQPPARFGAALGGTGRAGAEGFTIRGIGGNRVLIQVDGVRVPDGFSFGAQAAGRGDYVDLGLVKSVEILRGPASALYGSDGLAGAVSFTLSDPEDLLTDGRDVGVRLRGTYETADREFSETAILSARSGAVSGLIAYTRRDGKELETQGDVGGDGPDRTKANPQDTASDALLGRIVWKPSEDDRIRLTGDYQKGRVTSDVLSSRGGNRFTPAVVTDLDTRDTTKRVRAALDWTRALSGIADDMQLSVYWQDSENRQVSDERRTGAPSRTRINTFETRVYGAAAQFRSDFRTGTLSHRLVYGADASMTRQRGLRDGTVAPIGEPFPTRAFPETDFLLAGAFIADEITFADGVVTLFPALRFDHFNLKPKADPLLPDFEGARQDGAKLSPKFGAVVDLGGGISLFGNYTRGFRAPTPNQVNSFFENLIFGYTSLPNPRLKPETSQSFEAGVRVNTGGISGSFAAFTSDYDDFISQEVVGGTFRPGDPGVFQFVNLDDVTIKGFETRLGYRADSGFTADLAFSYSDGTETSSGKKAPLGTVDPLKLVAGLGWSDPRGRFGGRIIATHSARKSLEDSIGVCTGACFRPDGFTIFDATAFVRVADNFTVRAGLFNITDETYAWWGDVRGVTAKDRATDAYTRPGRNLSISLSANF